MGLHLYAILPADAVVPEPLTGVDGRPIRAVAVGPLVALASKHEAAPGPEIRRLREHDDVVRAAMTEQVTPVPVRYGQYFPDGGALRQRLETDAARWTALLARLAGHAEHGVRMAWRTEEREMHAEAGSGPGSRHMSRLMQRHAAARIAREEAAQLVELVREATSDCAVEQCADERGAERGTVAVALLVAAGARAAYDTAVAGLPARRPDVRFVFTGPWPPYSFVP